MIAASLKLEQVRLQRMIRRTMRAISNSSKLLQQTREVLKKAEARSRFRIKRGDYRIDRSTLPDSQVLASADERLVAPMAQFGAPKDPLRGRADAWVLDWSDDPKTPTIVGTDKSIESK